MLVIDDRATLERARAWRLPMSAQRRHGIGWVAIGDAAGLVLSGYVLLEAQRAGVSGATKRRMLRNMLVDFVVGLVPVVGDAFDAIFKANTRNTRLVRQDLLKQLGTEAPRRFPWGTLVGLSILFGVITAAGVALFA